MYPNIFKMSLLFGAILLILNINSGLCGQCPQPDIPGYLAVDPTQIHYYLYTQAGSTYTEIFPGQLSTVKYNPNSPVVFLTHGFNHTGFLPWIQEIKDRMFGVYTTPNVIIVDWSAICANTNFFNSSNVNAIYPYTAYRTTETGVYVGNFIVDMFNNWGIPLSSYSFAGHSLGAHLAGSAGQVVLGSTGQRLARIVGMDPAGPGFTGMILIPDCRLSSDDATVVLTIRTDVGVYGYVGDIAVDYYPNGGTNQPDCPSAEYNNPTICNHCYSYKLFSASLTTNGVGFESRNCSTYTTYEAGQCNSNTVSQMGFFSDLTIPSSNYLDTSSTSPYCMNGALRTSNVLGSLTG